MHSAGNDSTKLESWLGIVRGAIDLGGDLDSTLALVPIEIRDQVRKLWQQEHKQQTIFRRVPSILEAETGPRSWFQEYDPARGYHWPRLRSHLITYKGYSLQRISSLDDASDLILSRLESPSRKEPSHFRIQGLVLGRVQSGKTGNYTALIAKAVDAGYMLVIVLAGIHNQLRLQTQQRLTDELGLADSPTGIGIPSQGNGWSTITESHLYGDFRSGSIQATSLGEIPTVAVIKKNATVLRRFLNWIKERPRQANLPVLIIDDEADQASINMGGNREVPVRELFDLAPDDIQTEYNYIEEIEPSTINGLVRSLIKEFDRVSYVAYTATPFANVLIDPVGEDYEAGESLYPRDFIVSLPTADEYIGAKQLFEYTTDEDNQYGLDVISIVPDLDAFYLNLPQYDSDYIKESLETALLDFILSSAAKDYREIHTNQADNFTPSTMLIHTSTRTKAQRQLGELIRKEVNYLRNAWRYDSGEDYKNTEDKYRNRWNNEFQLRNKATADLEFVHIKPYIDRMFKYPIPVCVFNSKTEDKLDYQSRPGQKIIVIGGNRLSRGITLEGLLVSYFTRGGKNYDTVMQAGRWFGYRSGYADLTRLWTTKETYRHFRHLAIVEEDLREQLEVFERLGKSPRDVSPLIIGHPDLNVTAPNRMGVGQEYQANYAGQFIQSVRLFLQNTDILHANLDATKRFLQTLGIDKDDKEDNLWRGVQWQNVVEYISNFKVPDEATNFRPHRLEDYIRRQAVVNNELTEWCIALIIPSRLNEKIGTIDLGGTLGKVSALSRSRLRADPDSVGVLANPPKNNAAAGDQARGLTPVQITKAYDDWQSGKFTGFGSALRYQRRPTEGLLCIYPISKYSKARKSNKNRQDLFEDPDKGVPVIGLSLLFPPSDKATALIGGPRATG